MTIRKMTDIREYAKDKLLCEGYTCVIYDGENEILSRERGVSFLLSLYNDSVDLNGYFAADKVVGKGATLLYVLLGVEEIYAHVISKAALSVLDSYGIKCAYGTLVPNIINRKGDGICPIENATKDITDASDAPKIIQMTLEALKNANK